MRRLLFTIAAAVLLLSGFTGYQTSMPATVCHQADWGFFAHRRINRLAVLTLPPEMMVFFKKNIDWIADHAADADMRRYATTFEAPRHYIDLDEYGRPPFEHVPRTFAEALQQYSKIWAVTSRGDTLLIHSGTGTPAGIPDSLWQLYFRNQVYANFSQPDNNLDPTPLQTLVDPAGPVTESWQSAFFTETLSDHGILPWHLQRMQNSLTAAFRQGDSKRILRLSADMGHYIGDAHVPLHTTSNYNGQKTGQVGIHGFWESRIPELFADEQYDYFVGKPEYLANPRETFWEIVLASHERVDSVLDLERLMRLRFPQDRQMCPDMRNGVVIIAPCRDFAAAYQQAMDGMVERRMRSAIHFVASAWYTAWVDAGQPDLGRLDQPAITEAEQQETDALQLQYRQGRIKGRPEEH